MQAYPPNSIEKDVKDMHIEKYLIRLYQLMKNVNMLTFFFHLQFETDSRRRRGDAEKS